MKPANVPTARLVSKFVATYDRLFAGFTPEEISPHEAPAQFWANLLTLDVDAAYLGRKIRALSREDVLGSHKPLLSSICSIYLLYMKEAPRADVKAVHTADTLGVLIRCVLEKALDGWEVMEVLAGGVGKSDEMFLGLANTIEEVLLDSAAPPVLKQSALHLALIFSSSIGQLSPGAYFLRRDLFPALAGVATTPETQQYTFEAALLLSVLAGFHRSDAPRLNRYLGAIEKTGDKAFIRALANAANYAMDGVIKVYQGISDDSPPTFASSMSSLFASFRPDRALSSTPTDTPKELFKDQPVEAAVILLPVHDFLHLNTVFAALLIEPLISPTSVASTQAAKSQKNGESTLPPPPPLLHTFLSFSSYILTHASSVQSARAAAYASLCLLTLLHLVENDVAMSALVQPVQGSGTAVRICRQRLPLLPVGGNTRPVLCALLDCCVLWLRHNLHKRLETQSYKICIWILYQIIWFLSKTKRRLEYHWEELWRSLISLLDFLSAKMSSSPKVEQLVQETIVLLNFSLYHSESYLGTPQATYQFIYELVRSTSTLHKQHPACKKKPAPKRHASDPATCPAVALQHLLDVTSHYEKAVRDSGVKGATAGTVVRAIAREVEKDGVLGAREANEDEAPTRSSELGEIGFIRYAYADILALLPGPDT